MVLAGAKPAGDNGTYFQNLTLIGAEPQASTTLKATMRDGKSIQFRWLDDFVGVTDQQKPEAKFDAEAVFVGHGITAPEDQWDDYAGVDVRGKVVVMFTNEPPSDDPKFFTGKALTYYGRWTYKYEQAARKGAVAAIIIHTTPTASYGWEVVRSSWGREDQQVKLALGAPALAFAAWVTKEQGDKIAAAVGKSADELLKMADTKGLRRCRHSGLREARRRRFAKFTRATWSGGLREAIRAEERGGDLQRALGSSGYRPVGERRRHL